MAGYGSEFGSYAVFECHTVLTSSLFHLDLHSCPPSAGLFTNQFFSSFIRLHLVYGAKFGDLHVYSGFASFSEQSFAYFEHLQLRHFFCSSFSLDTTFDTSSSKVAFLARSDLFPLMMPKAFIVMCASLCER